MIGRLSPPDHFTSLHLAPFLSVPLSLSLSLSKLIKFEDNIALVQSSLQSFDPKPS